MALGEEEDLVLQPLPPPELLSPLSRSGLPLRAVLELIWPVESLRKGQKKGRLAGSPGQSALLAR